jgi:hypothetical protein
MPNLLLRRFIYAALGVVFTTGGCIALFNPESNLIPPETSPSIEGYILTLTENVLHTTMELATAIIPIGLLLIWAAINPNQTEKINYFFLLFFILFSSIHWYEFFRGNRTIISPLINSIPLVGGLIVLIKPAEN